MTEVRGALSLEFIGAADYDAMRQFDAAMTALGLPPDSGAGATLHGPVVLAIRRDQDGALRRAVVHGKRDYSRANSRGSRGVYVHYLLDQDTLYWVRARTSWRASEEYFAAVTPSGDIYRLTAEEATEWLNAL